MGSFASHSAYEFPALQPPVPTAAGCAIAVDGRRDFDWVARHQLPRCAVVVCLRTQRNHALATGHLGATEAQPLVPLNGVLALSKVRVLVRDELGIHFDAPFLDRFAIADEKSAVFVFCHAIGYRYPPEEVQRRGIA